MKLWDFQKKASEFLKNAEKAYLAMDMGTGKTLTALDTAYRTGTKNILIVAEKNEIVNSRNFEKEVGHFQDLDYCNARKENIPTRVYGRRVVCGINPEGLTKLDEKILSDCFDAMIVDEATHSKTTTTARFKKVYKVAQKMKYLFLLSGTPMMNGAAELYAPLLLLGHPLVAGKGAKGKEAFERVFAGGHRRKIKNTGRFWLDYAWWAKGSNNVRELRFLLKDKFFFVRKEDTGAFKRKTRTVKRIPMTLPWLAEYQSAWDEYLIKAQKRKVNMENVVELRRLIENGQVSQVNSRWKARQIVEDIRRGEYGEEPVLVFVMFTETEKQLLEEEGAISYEEYVENRETKPKFIVAKIMKHGKGGNLPEIHTTLFVGQTFIPAVNLQAENRIDRPEQKNEMKIVYYLTEGEDNVDTHIQNIVKDKMSKIDKFMKPLTQEEIEEMPKRLQELRAKFPKECELLGV